MTKKLKNKKREWKKCVCDGKITTKQSIYRIHWGVSASIYCQRLKEFDATIFTYCTIYFNFIFSAQLRLLTCFYVEQRHLLAQPAEKSFRFCTKYLICYGKMLAKVEERTTTRNQFIKNTSSLFFRCDRFAASPVPMIHSEIWSRFTAVFFWKSFTL